MSVGGRTYQMSFFGGVVSRNSNNDRYENHAERVEKFIRLARKVSKGLKGKEELRAMAEELTPGGKWGQWARLVFKTVDLAVDMGCKKRVRAVCEEEPSGVFSKISLDRSLYFAHVVSFSICAWIYLH